MADSSARKQDKQKIENERMDELIRNKKNYYKDDEFNIYFITGYNTIYIKGYLLDLKIKKYMHFGTACRDHLDLIIKGYDLNFEPPKKNISKNIFMRSNLRFEDYHGTRFFRKNELEYTIYFYLDEGRNHSKTLIETRNEYKPIMDDILKIYQIINNIHGRKSFKTAINYFSFHEPFVIDLRKILVEAFIKFNDQYYHDKEEAIKQIKYFSNFQRWEANNDENEFDILMANFQLITTTE